MASSIETVRQAVLALYHAPPTDQAQANTWLTEFQQSPDAWQTCYELIKHDEAPEVQFFAASLLVRKCRAEWHSTDPTLKNALQTAFSTTFQESLTWPNTSPLVLRQLCLLQAAALASPAPGQPGMSDLLAKALALLHVNPMIALELLTAIAEEADDLHSRRRAVTVEALLSSASQVYAALGALLMQTLQQGQDSAATQVLRAILAWAQLSPHPSAGAGGGGHLGPAEMHSSHPELFQAVLAAVSASCRPGKGEIAAGTAAVILAVLGSNTFGPEENHDAAALNALISALLSTRPHLASADDQAALAIAQIGASVGERWPEGACGALTGALPLAELMLGCLDRPELMVAEAVIDYFFMINTVAIAVRPPQLGPSLFLTMVSKLRCHVSYPEGFPAEGWEHDCSGIDQESFNRARDSVLPEAMQEAYGLLRAQYLAWSFEALQTASTWQEAESALYCIGAVALAARARALAGPEMSKEASVAEDAVATRNTLAAIFNHICSGTNSHSLLLSSHPALTCTACWLIEQYAVWFGKANEAPVHDAMQGMLVILGNTTTLTVANAASKAFNALCLRCVCRLRDPSVVSVLQSPVHVALQGQRLGLDNEKLLVEGMAQIAAGLANEQADSAAMQLTRPFVDELRAALAATGAGEPSIAARQAVVRSLELVAAALKSCLSAALASGNTAGASIGGPAVGVLRSVEDALDAMARSPQWQRDQEVMSALVELYKRAVCSARKRSLEVLPAVMPAVGAVFAATALPSCLEVLAEAVEIHFQDSSVVDQLMSGMGAACETAFPVLQGEGVRERGPLAAALLGLCDSFAVYAPAALWPSPLLPPLLSLATATVANARETEPVSKALSVLGHILATQERIVGDPGPGVAQGHIDAIYGVLAAQGQSIMDALMRALCDTCPRQLMRTASDRVKALLTHPALSQNAAGWFQTVVMSGQLPGTSEDVCAKLCSLAFSGQLRPARLMVLLVDFGLIARREETVDALLAYEL